MSFRGFSASALLFLLLLSPLPSYASDTAQRATARLILGGRVADVHGKPIGNAHIKIRVNGEEFIAERAKATREGFRSSGDGNFYIEIPVADPAAAVEMDVANIGFKAVERYPVAKFHPAGTGNDGVPQYVASLKLSLERKAGAAFYISASILLLVYVAIALDLLHRTLAAMMGAVAMLFISYTAGSLYPEYFIISFASAVSKVDFNVVFLLLGMMIIVGVMKQTGVFEWLAFKSFHLSGGNVFRLAAILIVVTAILSAFLNSVTTMLLLVPVTIGLAVALKINPVVFLMPEVLASNIGGTATLVGDPPNMMIGSYAGLTWNDFMSNLTPVIAIILVVHVLMMCYLYREEYGAARVTDVESLEKKLRAECGIKDRRLLMFCLAILGGVIFLFFIHGKLGMEPCIAALGGAVVLLVVSRENIVTHLEEDVEWPTLVFFIMLFIIIGACEETGLIQIAADMVLTLSQGNLLVGVALVLLVSAVISAVVDNIPYTATLLPVVAYLSQNTPDIHGSGVLWWALSLGACLGGNATLVGASANVVTVGLSEKQGYPISFVYFMKIGIPVTIMSVAVSAIWLYLVELR